MTIDYTRFDEKCGPVPEEMVTGSNAFCQGLKRKENPYSPGTAEHQRWDFGWQEAENYQEYLEGGCDYV